jgi:hypothetical protein
MLSRGLAAARANSRLERAHPRQARRRVAGFASLLAVFIELGQVLSVVGTFAAGAFGAAFAALAWCGCEPQAVHTAASSAGPVQSCTYLAEEVSAQPAVLEVTAACQGRQISGFSYAEPAAARFTQVLDSSAPLRPNGEGLQFATPQGEARVRYRVDLEGVASEQRHFDTALRIGHSLVTAASTFLLEPEPLEVEVPIALSVRMPKGEDFASGLIGVGSSADHRFSLQAHEMSVATYSIFGHFQRQAVAVGASTLEVVTADGRLDLGPAPTARWVSASARAVAQFYGRFPAPHALVLLLPVPDRKQVLFGKVLPQSAPGVAVLVGEHTPEPELYRDWILVHELFHIGFPSFHDEAKWLDEGSATYFEPLIRARAGYLTELEVWRDFARDMPQGLRAIEQEGLEHPSDYRSIYWGGAIACLLADVAARQRSGGTRGLQAGFRAVLEAGGNATQVWSLTQVSEVIDRALGAPVLREIIATHADRGQPVELPALLRRLGVVRHADGNVTLDDQAELAAIRHAITFGTP